MFVELSWPAFGVLAIGCLAVVAVKQAKRAKTATQFAVARELAATSSIASLHEDVIGDPSRLDSYAHAVSAVALDDGSLLAVWYQGTREGGRDVKLFQARYREGAWTSPGVLLDVGTVARAVGRAVKTVGNAIVFAHPGGELWLIFGSVSIGGWSGSSLNLTTSANQGVTWSPPRRLITVPFFNVGTLVRGRPVFFADGSVGLPIYQEFLANFPELAVLDARGRVVGKRRMSAGMNSAIQPVLMPFDTRRAVAFLRSTNRRVPNLLRQETDDAGLTWSALESTAMRTFGSNVDVLRLDGDRILMAHCTGADNLLRLSQSTDAGRTWREFAQFSRSPSDDAVIKPRLRGIAAG